jgi:hypothetical protein
MAGRVGEGGEQEYNGGGELVPGSLYTYGIITMRPSLIINVCKFKNKTEFLKCQKKFIWNYNRP